MEIFVGIVLYDDNNRVYLIKENDKNQIGKNRWNLPGGSVDMGESLVESAIRETKEETGYKSKIESLLGCYKCKKKDKSWIYIVFGAKVIGQKGKLIDPEIKQGKWFDQEEFLHLDSTELVHPDMQLVYNIATGGLGLKTDSIKYIDYDIQ